MPNITDFDRLIPVASFLDTLPIGTFVHRNIRAGFTPFRPAIGKAQGTYVYVCKVMSHDISQACLEPIQSEKGVTCFIEDMEVTSDDWIGVMITSIGVKYVTAIIVYGSLQLYTEYRRTLEQLYTYSDSVHSPIPGTEHATGIVRLFSYPMVSELPEENKWLWQFGICPTGTLIAESR